MAKPKLTTAQNMQLKELSLQQKLDLLHQWKKNGEISPEAFEHFSNLWIKKESRKLIDEKTALRRRQNENFELPRSKMAVESEINGFIGRLRQKLVLYISQRDKLSSCLSPQETQLFKKYAEEYFRSCRRAVNELLILGLRYPDKEINRFSVEFVRKNKKEAFFVDYFFWGSIWEDPDFVPLDAVRLMLKKENDRYQIDNCFAFTFIQSILPLMEAQRDKEVLRLAQAQMLEGREREQQVARKMHRISAFNTLIEAAKEYCN